MPLINYICECKNSEKKFFRRAKDAPAFFVCKKCGLNAKKSLSSPSSSSIVSIDNGVQAKSVEVNLEVVALNEERSTKDYTTED